MLPQGLKEQSAYICASYNCSCCHAAPTVAAGAPCWCRSHCRPALGLMVPQTPKISIEFNWTKQLLLENTMATQNTSLEWAHNLEGDFDTGIPALEAYSAFVWRFCTNLTHIDFGKPAHWPKMRAPEQKVFLVLSFVLGQVTTLNRGYTTVCDCRRKFLAKMCINKHA